MLDYAKFDFYLVAQRLQTFCSEDLGGFYLDILKDRLYTSAAKSPARRSAQTALALVTQMLLRLMAPMLSFTAEEAWAVLNPPKAGEPPESVFFQTWKDVLPPQAGEKELLARWKRIREIRAEAMKRLEAKREAREIGSSLQANIAIGASGDDFALLQSLGGDLKYVMITSSAALNRSPEGLTIDVATSTDPKCERCWHYRPDVGRDPAHPTICTRCVGNLAGHGEDRRHA
jgi:isoleucyl-tRNA synthetase